MHSPRKFVILAALALFLGLGCQIADVFADKPTPLPVQPTAVKSPVAAPPAAPTNAVANPTVAAPPTAAVAAPTSPLIVSTPTTAPSQAVCPNPNAAITSLAPNATLAGLIEIRGTAAQADMQYWKVEYRTDTGTSYTVLNNSDKAVTDGVLARWSTKTVPNGVYFVRLVIVQKDGNFGTPCEMRVLISN